MNATTCVIKFTFKITFCLVLKPWQRSIKLATQVKFVDRHNSAPFFKF